ncbi:di-N-acetylchitobiase [Enhydra lutris kenyoni]|uniref:Di-N-acetylchitobiase n=1 Tax=Enhydra lutris kenyoni TaxID=391180 RepID=A0A2Y9ITH7_ENHLU|nr:di-N-acetylchitobiase [Enhydra lutris kenyoni]
MSPLQLGHLCLLARPPHGIPGITVLLLSLLPFWAGAHCPCQDPALCQPITQHPDFEVFVFDVGNKTWKFYDWSQITTVVIFGKYDPELMCYAHSHGARVVLKGDAPLKDLINPSFRASWIAQKVKLAKTQYMDGINIDIEQEANCLSPEYYALTTLVKETTDFFHREIKGSQLGLLILYRIKVVSVDILISELRGKALFFIIENDLNCYDDYIKIGINPKKLVMGVPWYGYDYTCLNLLEDRVCTIPKVPSWRDSCGITSGHQVPYKVIMKQVNSSVSGSHWDKDQQASYYNYKDSSGHFHQVWYDDPQSISLKAAYIQKHGLRGIGMWHANCLDYSGDAVAKQQTEEMWKVLKPKL